MKTKWLALRIGFAGWLTGWRVLNPTDVAGALDAASDLRAILEHSGHLSWRRNVPSKLEMAVERLEMHLARDL